MLLRKKKNRSGTIIVVIVEKRLGKFKHIKTIGVSSDKEELERLHTKGREGILKHSGTADIFDDYQREVVVKLITDQLLSNIVSS